MNNEGSISQPTGLTPVDCNAGKNGKRQCENHNVSNTKPKNSLIDKTKEQISGVAANASSHKKKKRGKKLQYSENKDVNGSDEKTALCALCHGKAKGEENGPSEVAVDSKYEKEELKECSCSKSAIDSNKGT